MSHLLRIFTGTAEAVFPSTYEANPFSGFRPFDHGSQPYQLVRVNADGGIGQLLCFADFSVQPGHRVQGFSCREIGGTPVGVLVDDALAPLLSQGQRLEQFLEYTAFRLAQDSSIHRDNSPWYLSYPHSNESQAEAVVRRAMQSQEGNSPSPFLAKARVTKCSTKNIMRYCKATMTIKITGEHGRIFSFYVSRYVDHEVRPGTHLPVLIYPGPETAPAIHIFPLIPAFAEYMSKMEVPQRRLLERFLTGNTFRAMGRILKSYRFTPDGENNRCRIMITGETGQDSRYYARAISLYNRDCKNADSVCECSVSYPPGTILEAAVSTDSTGQYVFTDLQPLREPAQQTAAETPQSTPAQDARNAASEELAAADLLTVRDAELTLWRSSAQDADGSRNTHGKNKPFRSSSFQTAVLNRQIDLLHYDVLHWIGVLRYCTGNFIFRLFLSEMLPQDPQALSEEQRRLTQQIRDGHVTKVKSLTEGDQTYPVAYLIRNDDTLKKKIIQRLQEQGLIEAAGFIGRDSTCSPAKVLIITQQGEKLLQALRRRNCKFDTFAYLRSARYVKTILSANQLAIAYMQALSREYPLHMENLSINPCIIARYDGVSKESVVRAGFTLLVQDPAGGREVLLVGESIRNTVGLSRQLDDQNIREKIPRMLDVIRRAAQVEQRHTVLTFVFTSYEEMMSYGDFIREELNKLEASEYFHVYLTYDLLLMGPLEGSHFCFHPVTGNVERVTDMMHRIKDCLRSD